MSIRQTNDLAFASYVHMMGVSVVKAQKQRKNNVVVYYFEFNDSDNRWDELTFSFANSESRNFDSSVRTLKRLCR